MQREHHTIDATGKRVGRLATEIAHLLRGKHKTSFQPHIDAGDFVKVTNVDKMEMTGNLKDKVYNRYTGYPGGIRSKTAEQLMDSAPEEVLHSAVRGMLPSTKLRPAMLKRLTIQ